MTEASGSKAILIGLAGVLGTLLGATISPLVNYWTNERQMDVKMVELGIGILREPPKEGIAVMRAWAIDIIDASSRQKFTPEQRTALQKNELPIKPAEAATVFGTGMTFEQWQRERLDRADKLMNGVRTK